MNALPVIAALALATDDLDPERYRPAWTVGQTWTIETVTRQVAARRDPPAAEPVRVRWKFAVQATEKIDDRDCFRVQITCLAGDGDQPIATLWVDRLSMTLRQVQTQMPTAAGVRTLTETYRSAGEQPFPAFSPLTVPPLELPLLQGKTKGTETFSYEASSSPPGIKAVGDVGFSFAVKQQFSQPADDQIKDLLPESYAKSLEKKPTLEVRLEAARAKVRQLWQPGQPWPVYSDNGISQARLVE